MPDNSILSIVQDACDEMAIPRPDTLIASSDETARQYLSVISRCGEIVANEPDTGWEILQKLHEFVSVLNQAEYDLPSDYGRLTIDTVWDRAQLTPMQGPLSPAMWQTIKSGLIGNGIYFTRYRVVRSSTSPKKVFVVDPNSPTAGADLVYEYQSTDVWADAGLTATSTFPELDTDVTLLPRQLMFLCFKWRWRREKGLEYSTFLEEYNQELDKYSARDRPQPGFSMEGNRYRQNFLGYMNIPDTGYGH